MQNILWPFYKWPLSHTQLPSFTVRDIKRITPSYLLAIIWQTPQLNKQPNKCIPKPFYQFTIVIHKKRTIKTQEASQHKGYWCVNNTLVLPELQIKSILTALHQVFHSNPLSLLHFIKIHITPNPNFHKTLKEISSSCNICSKTNPLSNIRSPSFPTHQARGYLPGSDWQVDFTNMPPN
jgi:hypothetical protein